MLFYDILRVEGKGFARQWEVLQQLSEWGLKTDAHNKRCSGLADIRKFHESLGKKRDEFDYEIDGVVIKVDDHRNREKLGSRQCSPRWALAWKFPPQTWFARRC